MRDLTGRRAVPEIRQSEAAECGLACLAMVLGYHGHDTDLGTLRRRHPTSLNGTTMRSLMSMASRMELSTRALRLEPEQLGQLKLPAILHWDMDHFVVLTRVGRRGDLVVHDPASGMLRVSATEVSKRFTGIALEISPTRSFTKADERSALRLRDLLGSLHGFGGPIGQILVLWVLLQLYVLVSPFFMQLVVDDAVAKGDPGMLVALAAGFGLLVLLNAGAALLRSFVLQYVQSAISVSMGVGLFRHMIRLPFGYFEKRHVGDLVSRFGSAELGAQHAGRGRRDGFGRWRHGDPDSGHDADLRTDAGRPGRRRPDAVQRVAAWSASGFAAAFARPDREPGA